jgi:hypothetical protein
MVRHNQHEKNHCYSILQCSARKVTDLAAALTTTDIFPVLIAYHFEAKVLHTRYEIVKYVR